jgi:hypothetical protein
MIMNTGNDRQKREPEVATDRADTLIGLLRPGASQLYETRSETKQRVREMLRGQQQWLRIVLGVVALFLVPVVIGAIWNPKWTVLLRLWALCVSLPYFATSYETAFFACSVAIGVSLTTLYAVHWFVWGIRYTAIAYALEEVPTKKFWDAKPLLLWPLAYIFGIVLVPTLTRMAEVVWLWAYYYDTWYCGYAEGVIALVPWLPTWCVLSSLASIEGFIDVGCYRFQVLNTVMLRRSLWLRPELCFFFLWPFGFPGVLLGILTMGRSVLWDELWFSFRKRVALTLLFFVLAPAVCACWISTFNYQGDLREEKFWEVAKRVGLEEEVKETLRRDKDVRSDY